MRSNMKWIQFAIAAALVALIFMPWFEVGLGVAGAQATGYDLIMNAYECTLGDRPGCQNADYGGWVIALAGVLLIIGILMYFGSGMPMIYRLVCAALYVLVPIYALYSINQEVNSGLVGEIGLGDAISDAVWDWYSGWLKLALGLCVLFIFIPSDD